MRPPRQLTQRDLEARTRVIDAVQFTQTEDPAEIERRVAAWVRENGPYTHVMLWCAPHVVTDTGEPTTVVVPRNQPVTPCRDPGADIVPATDRSWRKRVRADKLPYLAECYAPLSCATNDPADSRWLVRARKLGANRLVPA